MFIKYFSRQILFPVTFQDRVIVGTFVQCRYNQTLSYFLDNFSAKSVVIAMCNPDKSQ